MTVNGVKSTVTTSTVDNVMSNQHPYILEAAQIVTGSGIVAGDVVARLTTITEAGDAGNNLATWVFNGVNHSNSNNGYLYYTSVDVAGTRTVSIYKLPVIAAANLVAQGSRVGDGAITLSETLSSGLTGSVAVTYTGDDITIADNILTTNLINWQKYDVTGANQVVKGICKSYDSTTGNIQYWVHGVYNYNNITATNATANPQLLQEALATIGLYSA